MKAEQYNNKEELLISQLLQIFFFKEPKSFLVSSLLCRKAISVLSHNYSIITAIRPVLRNVMPNWVVDALESYFLNTE